ncbi:MAG: TOBE-like domain-containing protein, partial [Casimicrobiaceae bacterium]
HGRVEQVGSPDEVYDHPATPFVFEFMGHVNRLPSAEAADPVLFARPHDIAVAMTPGTHALPARLVHGSAVGPAARLEFALESAHTHTINVEMTRERWRELALHPGDVAYLTPTRVHRLA